LFGCSVNFDGIENAFYYNGRDFMSVDWRRDCEVRIRGNEISVVVRIEEMIQIYYTNFREL